MQPNRFPGLLVLAAAGMFAPVFCRAQAPADAPSTIPVRRVTLFSSGVAYMERRGEVEGDATVPLRFRVGQINDILKSMVLLDSTGRVQAATYAAKDPMGRALQAFAVDVTGEMRMEQILTQLRGARVSVESPGKPTLTGQIVSVEHKQVAGDTDKPINATFLNLLTESGPTQSAGLMIVKLDGEKTIRFLDERINREFKSALGLLASGTDDQRRQVTLHFSGNGRREVRVGYVVESPIWKMSYRLLLGGAGAPGGKPYLQGWAMVENTTDEDWQAINLSLVSGRPVSFIEDLYQPLYIPRPEVGPDIVASPLPQTHDGSLEGGAAAKGAPGAAGPPALRLPNGALFNNGVSSSGSRGGFGGGGAMGPRGEAGPSGHSDANLEIPISAAEMLRASVVAAATGEKAGALFQYNISQQVTLPRQQAALIPVLTEDVEAEKVLLYNANTGSKYPLYAVRLHNVTNLHLKGGPVTLFDDGVYAGDARMEDVPQGDTRLLSYAVDLSVEVSRQAPVSLMTEMKLALRRGVLTTSRTQRIETTYLLKSRSDKERTVLLEHPVVADFKLVEPAKPLERTATLYRFSESLPAGQSRNIKIVAEKQISQGVAIVSSDLDELVSYSTNRLASPKLKAALQEVIQRRRRVQELQAAATSHLAEIQAITADQERVRKNMAALDKASPLYKRYVGSLDAQETRIQALTVDANRLRAQADAADRELRAYLDTLPGVAE